jgi:sigma-B regulation protein RsbU (phosphoserine phosphatase)
MEGTKFTEGRITLGKGDKLFHYTDGVTEATNANNELYGKDRLLSVLNKNKGQTPKETLSSVKSDIDDFVGEAPQFDDITMLCVEYRKKTF